MPEAPWTIPSIAIAVDLAVFTVMDGMFQIMLVERGVEPYRGLPALPGGFLHDAGESLDAAAARELAEETGLDASRLHWEQLGTYGEPDRDPRQRVVTVCYLAFVVGTATPQAGGDARAASWVPTSTILKGDTQLAFDHRQIIDAAVERARSKLEYTTLAATFCDPEFTVTDLRQVYEIVWDEHLDPRNFHRKVTGVTDFLVPTGRQTVRHGGRPAALFRRGSAHLLHPAMLRPCPPRPASAIQTS
ncbi:MULTISPECIES: NUDIX hydrolase [Actinoalloteichus]|uniref:ADP-ribose pyrophosphatase n=1 Tax=Actinoalloteichus fjordicus TaxID=1612552 RepID=A0AAC9LEL7_9PSEU|nr:MULTISPECIES: NUDIX domain-containing protein [Actinoalloteichus]APU15444.1 ADP-ribose pyrophosphatase [Actinoalloteichus fjordicus]APU21512.1 ADP-ribose pyrophosphatase [Actinoalloteichus sp. GBA129-24]